MAARRHKTSIDYVIIALNPALIVMMIAGLVYFLSLCFYRGDFIARINYILFLFIVAAVGIARIAIEDGRAKASAYALGLACATLISVSRFVGEGLPLTIVLLGVIWFLSDRITIDCTVIDEGKDASGEGLLQGGLFGGKKELPIADVSLDGTTVTASEQAVVASTDANESTKEPKKRRKKTHRPGMWILYLAFGAIPLYGLGQVFLPESDAIRNSALKSLAIYLGSSLLLLVTTSFLGMRRYLRQRGVDMPAGISFNWLGAGACLVAALLLVCFMLPLPGKILSAVQLPAYLDTPDGLKPSEWGWGDEGVKSEDKNMPHGNKGEESSKDNQQSGADGRGEEKSGGERGSKGESGDSKDKKGNPKGSGKNGDKGDPEGKGQSDDSKESQQKQPGDKAKSESKQQEGKSGEQSKGEQAESNSQQGEEGEKQSEQDNGDNTPKENPQSSEDKRSEQSEQAGNEPSSTPPPKSRMPDLTSWLPNLSSILRFLIFTILVCIVAFYALKNWDAIIRWWQELLGLWGNGDETEDLQPAADGAKSTPRRPFSSYRNPLKDPSVTLEQAVVTTFAALGAWARENQCERKEYTTPAEFADQLSLEMPEHRKAISSTCEMYNAIAYGNRRINPKLRPRLEEIWQMMSLQRLPPAPPPVAMDTSVTGAEISGN